MNITRALTQMWTMLSRTRVFRLALTILCVFAALKFILQKRAAQLERQRHRAQQRTGTGTGSGAGAGAGGRRAGAAGAATGRSASRRAAAAARHGRREVGSPFDDDLSPIASKLRSPREQYLRPSRRRYPICVAASCVFSQTTVSSPAEANHAAPTSGDATNEKPSGAADTDIDASDEKSADSNAAVLPATAAAQQTSSKYRFHLASHKTSEILTKLVEYHDVYLVFHLGRNTSKAKATSESNSQSSSAEAEMTKAVLDFCRDLNLFDAGLREHRVLFCTTDIGKTAIMRQLEPHLLVEDDLDNAQQLAKVLPNSRVVLTRVLERKLARIVDVAGFDEFFSEKSSKAKR